MTALLRRYLRDTASTATKHFLHTQRAASNAKAACDDAAEHVNLAALVARLGMLYAFAYGSVVEHRRVVA